MDKFFYRKKGYAYLALIAVGLCSQRQAKAQVDGIAAVVNDRAITFSQVKKEVGATEAQYREIYHGLELVEKLKEARLGALKSLIERELIIQEFKQKGWFIPDNIIEDRFRGIIKQQYDGDRTALIRTLQANGTSVSNFKDTLKEQMVVQAMRSQNVSSSVIVSPFQIEQYYQENIRQFLEPDQVKLKMIYRRKGLFKEKRTMENGEVEEVDPEELLMKELLRKIETGSDFNSLARAYSDRSDGGSMGWVSEDTLRKELARAAFKLRPGQNSGVIKTDDGFYVLQVEEIKKATVVPLAEVRDQIETTLKQQERERLQQEWLDSLRAKAFIKPFY